MQGLKIGRVLLAALVFCAGSGFAADSQLLNLVMPDAQVMAGINVVSAEGSPLGQFLLNKFSATPGNLDSLQKFIQETGFDPRTDVTELLAASNGNTTTPTGLLLAKGNFNVSQFLSVLANDKTHQASNYGGATLITPTDATQNHAIAFLGTNVATIAIVGDLASVKAAVDRSGSMNSISTSLANQVNSLSTGTGAQDAWSVSVASLGALIPGAIGANSQNGVATQTLQLVKNIQSASSGIKFGANVQFTAQAVADTPQNATALADVIKMVTGLISMSAAGQNQDVAVIAQLLQSVQVSTSGTAVNIAATIPESQIEAALNAAAEKKTAGPAKARKL
ncbi:MAG TPA: hypothetical protein VKB79_08195 [Bryobacteraceae bacterium]|nr:hypothetical protein [Bryobacteraceae bacterium]